MEASGTLGCRDEISDWVLDIAMQISPAVGEVVDDDALGGPRPDEHHAVEVVVIESRDLQTCRRNVMRLVDSTP